MTFVKFSHLNRTPRTPEQEAFFRERLAYWKGVVAPRVEATRRSQQLTAEDINLRIGPRCCL